MTALACAAGVTLGGGTVWNHSVSSGPKNTLTTFTPPGRSSARMHCAAERQAAEKKLSAAAEPSGCPPMTRI